MTKALVGEDIGTRINGIHPGAAVKWVGGDVWVDSGALRSVAAFLKKTHDLDFSFLVSISAVDYIEYFEVVYHLLSMRFNRSLTVKTRVNGRDNPTLPSLSNIWKGADLQEREIWDLMGIRFEGHPNMKRVLLWEGFDGHPLRKDFLR